MANLWRFFAICEKPYGGGGGVEINPPPVRGLILLENMDKIDEDSIALSEAEF